MSTILVTGSSGFIGKNLIKKLDNPICIPHEQILSTDWSQANKVFFLSSYGNMSSHTDEQAIIQANVIELCFVLATVDWSKIESFVFVSTSSVKRKVQTMYSRTKKAAEELCLAYLEKYNAPITIIRPLSATGVGEQKEHLIPKLIDSCLNGTKMPFVSSPTHDYINVDDLTDGIINLSNNKAQGIFELGTGIATTNREVLNIVEALTHKKANVEDVGSLRAYDSELWISQNFSSWKYGWKPKKSLELSILEMIDETRYNLSN
jgi:nucleoside-diphosphate-sugar epimerase